MDWTYFLPVLYAFIASLGFGGLYNLHGRAPLFWAAAGGALGWLAYLITLLAFPDVFAGFVSAAVVAAYAEVLARVQKRTVTTYLLIGIIPMVPGAGIYHTMEYCIQGNTGAFITEGLHTLAMAGALAIGNRFHLAHDSPDPKTELIGTVRHGFPTQCSGGIIGCLRCVSL